MLFVSLIFWRKKKPHLKNFLHHIGLLGIFLLLIGIGKSRTLQGSVICTQVTLASIRKVTENVSMSKQVRSVSPWLLLQAPGLNSCLSFPG